LGSISSKKREEKGGEMRGKKEHLGKGRGREGERREVGNIHKSNKQSKIIKKSDK
jgi:hypothetical protein